MPQSITSFATQTNRISPWRFGQILLILVFSLVYWRTLDTGLQPYELRGGDLITHQYAQVQARPGNAPGYPLYTLGGWLWFHGLRGAVNWLTNEPDAPPPNTMPILSSYSTVWALLALWLLLGIFAEIAGPTRQHDRLAAAVAWLLTAFFGFTYFFWYYATTTEQYSSAVAQTLAIVLVYLRWEREPRTLWRLYLLALLCGLSLAHMLTVAFIVPPLVAVVLCRAPWLLRSARAVGGALLAAALPLTGYVYVWLRGAHNPQWWGKGDWATPQAWFWDFIGTAQGREELLWGFEPGRTFFGNGFPEFMWQELSIPLLLLGLIGIRLLPRRLPAILYGTLAIYLLFCWAYRFGNWFQVIIPAYPLILLGVLPLTITAVELLRRRSPRLAALTQALLIAGLLVGVAWRVDASLPAANSRDRQDDTALHRAADLLAQAPSDAAWLFAAVDDALALDYLINIWGIRPDLTVVSSPQAEQLLAQGHTVYATWDATPLLLHEIALSPTLAGITPDWIALQPDAPAQPGAPPAHIITPDLALLNITTRPAPAPIGVTQPPALDVTLTWVLATGVWPDELAISLRPLRDGQPMFDPDTGEPIQQDRPRPVHGLWQNQPAARPVLIVDSYRLPNGASAHALLLILYTQAGDEFHNLAELVLPVAGAP